VIPELKSNELPGPPKMMKLKLVQSSSQTKQPDEIISSVATGWGEHLPQDCTLNSSFITSRKDRPDHDSHQGMEPATGPKHEVAVQDCYEISSDPVNSHPPVDSNVTHTHWHETPTTIPDCVSTSPYP
jgi:hypothetical protein